jgi:hypothetical protein
VSPVSSSSRYLIDDLFLQTGICQSNSGACQSSIRVGSSRSRERGGASMRRALLDDMSFPSGGSSKPITSCSSIHSSTSLGTYFVVGQSSFSPPLDIELTRIETGLLVSRSRLSRNGTTVVSRIRSQGCSTTGVIESRWTLRCSRRRKSSLRIGTSRPVYITASRADTPTLLVRVLESLASTSSQCVLVGRSSRSNRSCFVLRNPSPSSSSPPVESRYVHHPPPSY